MSKGQALRVLVSERLTAAAEEIFVLFERTIAEYEEELCRLEKENQRKQRLLDVVLNPRVVLPRAGAEVPENHRVTQTQQIKEEPNEKSIHPEPQVFGTEMSALLGPPFISFVMKEEPSLLEQSQIELREETQDVDVSSETDGDTDSDSSSDSDSNDDSSSTDTDDAMMATEADGEEFHKVHAGDGSICVRNPTLHCKFKCSVCHRKFKSEHGLLLHSRTHREDYCPLCEKKYGKKLTPEEHRKVHTRITPFSCPFCNKKFAQMNQLEAHIKVHSGDKTYSCSVCKKTFSDKGNLDAHAKLHAGEKPWSCSLCHKDFTNLHNLRMHMKTHM